jgi:hypothetical protein
MQNRKSNETKTNCGIGKKRRISTEKNCETDEREERERAREKEREGACVSAAAHTRGHHQQRTKGRTLG